MATCACNPDHDGKGPCLCGRRLKVAIAAPAELGCEPRKMTVELWSGRRVGEVQASTGDTLTLDDATAFAKKGGKLYAFRGNAQAAGAYTGRAGDGRTLTGVTGLANLPPGTTVESPPGRVDDFTGTATITGNNGIVTPDQIAMTDGYGAEDVGVLGDGVVNIQATVTQDKVEYTGSVTVTATVGCRRLKLEVSGFTGDCGTNLNGNAFFNWNPASTCYVLDEGSSHPSGIAGGTLACWEGVWGLRLECPTLGTAVTGSRNDPTSLCLCPPMDAAWQLAAGGACGEDFDCTGQTGAGDLRCVCDEPSNPCPAVDNGCADSAPDSYKGTVAGISKCGGCLVRHQGYNAWKVTNVTYFVTQFCVKYASSFGGSCTWKSGVIGSITVDWYEETDDCITFMETVTYDIVVWLILQGNGYWSACVWTGDVNMPLFLFHGVIDDSAGSHNCYRTLEFSNDLTDDDCGHDIPTSCAAAESGIGFDGTVTFTPCCL